MDFDSMQKAGSRLGTGTMIVLDDQTCPVGMVLESGAFFRAGIVRLVHAVLERAGMGRTDICRTWKRGTARPGDLEKLASQTRLLGPGHTFCALAPGAAEPLQSALKYFRDDFERHIHEKRCPWRH